MDTSTNQSIEEDIKTLLQEVPPQIQSFFKSGRIEVVSRGLFQKYHLHVDQGAILEREIIFLLLGLKGPDEFFNTLSSEANLDEGTITAVTKDINDQIFIPIRDAMRRGESFTPQIKSQPPPAPRPQPWVRRPVVEAPKPEPPLPSQQTMSPERAKKLEQMVPTPSYGIPATPPPPPQMPEQEPMQAPIPEWEPNTKPVDELPRGTFAPPLQSPRYPGQDRLSSYIREVTRPKPPSINRLQTTPTQPPPPPREPQRAEPSPPQITDDARLLEDREEPSPILPGTVPPQPIPRPQQAPQSEPIYRPQRSSQPPPPPPRPYASDPYREPVDEGDLQY